MSNMLAVHQEQIKNMVGIYGAYEVLKVLKEYAVAESSEYKSLGNHEAIIHMDAFQLQLACNAMALSHLLRSKDVPQ